MMIRTTRVLGFALWLLVAVSGTATAQFGDFEEIAETRWGATVYGGGDPDDIQKNYLFGLRGSYKFLELDPLIRISPEFGGEFRKNFLLAKVGGRLDSRELVRFSLFGGIGLLRIQDITNAGGDGYDVDTSAETTYLYYGAKFRMPKLSEIPVLGRILGEFPIEGVSFFVAQETTGLTPPELGDDHAREFVVDEWYDSAIHIGVMMGSATGWHKSSN